MSLIAGALVTAGLAEPETLARPRAGHDRAAALHWTRRAAKHASSMLAFVRGVELHTDAVALAADDAERLELLEQLADAHVEAGRRSDAGTTSLEAATLAHRVGALAQHTALRARAGEHFLPAGCVSDRGPAGERGATAPPRCRPLLGRALGSISGARSGSR